MDTKEIELRNESERLNQLQISDCRQKKPYVFISYKSDDWRVALEDIAFTMQKRFGLRVYYDRAFESNNDIWVKSMKANMESIYCKAVIAVYSEKYVNSYATLLEILTSQKEGDVDPKEVIPVFLPVKIKGKEQEVRGLKDYVKIAAQEGSNPTGIKKTEWDALMECVNNFNFKSNRRTDDHIKEACEQFKQKRNCEDLTTQDVRTCFRNMEEQIAGNQNHLGNTFYDNLYLTIRDVEERMDSGILENESVFDELLKNEADFSIPMTPALDSINFSRPKSEPTVDSPSPEKRFISQPESTTTFGTASDSDMPMSADTPKPSKPQPTPVVGEQLHGSYSLYDLTTLKEYKGFTAKWFNMVGMRVTNHPQFNITPCKTVSVLTQQFVNLCIREQGEAYIHRVNKKNQGSKNPVFVKTDMTQNYKVIYSKIDVLPEWSMNINFSPYNFLKELRSRVEELNINPQDVELIFVDSGNSVSDSIAISTETKSVSSTGSASNVYRDAAYAFMDQNADYQGTSVGSKSQPIPKAGEQLHGSYSLYDLTTLKEYKGFTAKWFSMVGMRVAHHPQYTITPCKTVSVLTQQFVNLCIMEQGEAYIHRVNKKNQGSKNPVFVKTNMAQNYKVMYSKIDVLPEWSMNINFSPYNFLKELRSRVEDLAINPKDVELVFDELGSFTSEPASAGTEPDSDKTLSTAGELHGSYSLYDLTTLREYKEFTAKWFSMVGMRVVNHPQYTITPCKTVSVLTQQFVNICIMEQGEVYIHMVNQKNQGSKNPVFVKTNMAQKYKVMYSKIDVLPEWSMNINFSPYNFLKVLRSRVEELNINSKDVELIFDDPGSFTSE